MTPKTPATMFRSARKAGNSALIAFVVVLFAALALQLGAFLPRLPAAGGAAEPPVASSEPAAPVLAGAGAPAAPRG